MNLHDAQRMEETLRPAGYVPTEKPEQAALILINTCSVRKKSYEKVLSAIGRYGLLKRTNPDMILAVAGCVAQQEGSRLLEMASQVDLVFSPDHIGHLPTLVEEAREERRVKTGFVDPESYRFLTASPAAGSPSPPTALVTIQKGCDNACAYCIVPSVRGPAVSRPAAEVIAEIEHLVASGVKEVTLIGQNVNAFRGGEGGDDDFIRLLERVERIDGLYRLRFTTSHPKDIHPRLPQCFRSAGKLQPWFHLPVQSGSSQVLARMSRGYTRESYLRQVERLRDACPELTLGTDIIVGFPGETESEFLETVSLIEHVQYDYAYSFKFSIRPETPAESMTEKLSEEEKRQRLAHLQSVQDQITKKRLARFEGKTVPVLVEGPSRQGSPQVCGRSPGNHVVNFEAPEELIGGMVDVRITQAGKHSLTGELVERSNKDEARWQQLQI